MKKLALLIAAFSIPATMLFARPVSAAIDTTPDCDTVAIIKCGSSSVSELQTDASKGDVPTVYNNFGISHSELKGFVDGVVWKDGRVTLGTKGEGKLVATNAITAGRWNNPTSDMTKIPNTDRAYRMSTSHFVDDGQIAFVKIVNGKFDFAVIKTCGNPVTAKAVAPPTPPNLTVTKDVMSETHQIWGQTVTIKPGEQVAYKVVGTNTGKTTLQNVTFHDVLPQGITFQTGAYHAMLNGHFISNDLNDGMNIGTLTPGQKFELIYAVNTPTNVTKTATCTVGLTNRAFVKATDLPERSDTAVVKICAPPKPVYSCNLITGNSGSNRSFGISDYRVTATNGAVFTHMLFDWGDGTTSDKKPAEIKATTHSYGQDGTYTVKAIAYFMVNGKEVPATSDKCVAKVTFTSNQPPVVDNPPPGKLIDTGPGSIIGAVTSVMAGSTLAYRFVWLRRYN